MELHFSYLDIMLTRAAAAAAAASAAAAAAGGAAPAREAVKVTEDV